MIDRIELRQRHDLVRKRRTNYEMLQFGAAICAVTDVSFEEKQCLLDQMSYYDYCLNRRAFFTYREVFQSLGLGPPASLEAHQANARLEAFLSQIQVAHRRIPYSRASTVGIIIRGDIEKIKSTLKSRISTKG